MPTRQKLASEGGDENNECDFVFSRPLHPGMYWARVDGQSGPAVEIGGELVCDMSSVHSWHPAWPNDIKTMADADGRVEWFLYPDQYLTEAQCLAVVKEAEDALGRIMCLNRPDQAN